ncbi:ATP-binding protein of ABC transporter system [Bifidobacterium parmae]|uniref:ATP-binding protein of ABC transporter system n=2 Tax=Bifidobacterium parmae TaxID=361854 RepID=A0A2N5IYX6_9BIFI|nr:ATP-binding protein of ABC transporter system [Bifidobacterium parmae]
MHAVFYKNLIQLRHDPTKLLVIGLTIIGSAAIIALVAGTDLTARLASPLYQCAFAIIGVGLAPLIVDAFRDDAAEGVIATLRASGQATWRYPVAQLVTALLPPAVLSLLFATVPASLVPSLRPLAGGGQGVAATLTPVLIVAATYLYQLIAHGKAIFMTTDTLDHGITDGASDATTSTAPLAIRVRNLTFGYKRDRPVLERIDLDVPEGQSLGILGYNGAGKTTLFSLITGLLRPWHGSAAINADVFHSMRDVFQLTESGNLAMTMTIRENLRFRAMLYATRENPHPIDLEHLDALPMVRAFELQDQLDKKAKELSTGLRKRAGIMAGLLFDPKLILLDEPTNAVDPITRQLLIDLMRQLKADGRTILTITHDLGYCWQVADRVVVLDDRRIVRDRMVAGFADEDAFRKAATLGRERDHVDFGLRK